MSRSETAQTTRRRFLKTAAVASSAAFAPFAIHAADKAGKKRATVGEGEHLYECIHDWGMSSLPNGHNYGNATHGVAVDAQGLIYVTHHGGPDSIFVFDPDGKFVRSMGGFHRTTTGKGHGIDIRNEGGEEYLYLSPNESSLFFAKTNLKGEVVWQRDRAAVNKETGKYSGKERFRPTNASFRPDGGYYLGDGYGSNWIFEFTAKDKFVRAIGGTGTQDGQFKTPHGQWLDTRDGTSKLVIADRANARLQWFDMDGKHVRTQDGFLFPADIDVQGEVLMVPDLHARITLLGKDNKVLAQLGDDEEWRAACLANGFKMRSQRDRWKPGRFVHPHDACFDSDGNIFVAEWVATGRFSKLVRKG